MKAMGRHEGGSVIMEWIGIDTHLTPGWQASGFESLTTLLRVEVRVTSGQYPGYFESAC